MVVVVNQSCHQDDVALHAVIQDNNVVFTHIPSMIMLDVAYVPGSL